MITEIEMRYAMNQEIDANVCAGLVKFELNGQAVTINEPETGRAVQMTPHQARDLTKRINEMLDIVHNHT